MYLGKVIGTVIATVKNENLAGLRLLVVQPFSYARVQEGEAFVAIDTVSAGKNEWIFYVKSREAANALDNKFTPTDRTIIGIVDEISLQKLDDSTGLQKPVQGGPS